MRITLTLEKSRLHKKGKSIFIEISDLDDIEDEELLSSQLSSLPKIVERGENYFEVPSRYFQDVLLALEFWDLEIVGEIPAEISQYIESRNRITESDSGEFNFKTRPFEHQLESFEYAKSHPSFLLGDEQGLGKIS